MSSSETKTLAVRVDAGGRFGAGHLMRCLALIQAWSYNGGGQNSTAAHILATALPPALEQRLKAEGCQLHIINAEPGSEEDLTQTLACLQSLTPDFCVLDGYQFGTEFHKAITQTKTKTKTGFPLLVIDDTAHLDSYDVDIVLNQNLHADRAAYEARMPQGRTLLAGPDYVMLRREFRPWLAQRSAQSFAPIAPKMAWKIMLAMGGSDPYNQTSKLIQAAGLISGLIPDWKGEFLLVVGSGTQDVEALKTQAAAALVSVTVLHDVKNMPALFSDLDLALSSAGTTVWELCFMGVPLLLGAIAEQEVILSQKLEQAGGCDYLGLLQELEADQIAARLAALILDQTTRQQMANIGQNLVDGRGSDRIVQKMFELLS